MRFWERVGIAVMGAWLLFALHEGINALVRAHNWQPMTISDWGTWIGSIGTVATLIGTIVLATADKREAKKQAADRAVVAAAALAPRLQIVGDALQTSVETFIDFTFDLPAVTFRVHADLIEKTGDWNDDEILPLIVLPDHVCARLAGIRPVLREVIADMRDMSDSYPYSWVQATREKRRGEIIASLVTCRDTIQFAVDQCKRTVQVSVRA